MPWMECCSPHVLPNHGLCRAVSALPVLCSLPCPLCCCCCCAAAMTASDYVYMINTGPESSPYDGTNTGETNAHTSQVRSNGRSS
jgi:hypothetical protein